MCVCEEKSVRLSSPSLTAESSPPRLLAPHTTERGLISQLSTHFLRLSPSRSHTLLLLLPSVPFSISLPPSIILRSPSLTFMPSISLMALLHFPSSLSLFLSFFLSLCMILTVLYFYHFLWFNFGILLLFLPPSALSQWPFPLFPSSVPPQWAEINYVHASSFIVFIFSPLFPVSFWHMALLCFVLYRNDGTSRAICPWLAELCV